MMSYETSITAKFIVQPVTLEGTIVRLEPLTPAHLGAVMKAGADPSIHRWSTARMDTPEAFRAWLDAALADANALPFVTVARATGEVIGSTRFAAIDRANLRVEIGWTWLTPRWQRTGANRDAKLLMLRHAFETWGVRRVELKAHAANEQSRIAMARLGAVEEGTLRRHMVMHDGSARDTVYFSILDSEWPAIKARLTQSIR